MIPPKEKGLFMVPLLNVVLSFLLLSNLAFAESKTYSVFDIKKTVPLHNGEKTYRDYYVNLGADAGAKAGSILAVYRRQGVVDYYRNTLHDDLLVPVGHIKVIMADKTMSVARLESLTPAKQIPVVEFNAIMLGDRVQLTAFDAKKSGVKSRKARNKAVGKVMTKSVVGRVASRN